MGRVAGDGAPHEDGPVTDDTARAILRDMTAAGAVPEAFAERVAAELAEPALTGDAWWRVTEWPPGSWGWEAGLEEDAPPSRRSRGDGFLDADAARRAALAWLVERGGAER